MARQIDVLWAIASLRTTKQEFDEDIREMGKYIWIIISAKRLLNDNLRIKPGKWTMKIIRLCNPNVSNAG